MTTQAEVSNQPLPNEADVLGAVHGFRDVFRAAGEMARIREIARPEGNWVAVGSHDDDVLGIYDEQNEQWRVRDPEYVRARGSAEDVARLGGEENWSRQRVSRVGRYQRMQASDGSTRLVAIDDRGFVIVAPETEESEGALQTANFELDEEPDFTGGTFSNPDEQFFPRAYANFAPDDGASYVDVPRRSDITADTRGRYWTSCVKYWEGVAARAEQDRDRALALAAAAETGTAQNQELAAELERRPAAARVIYRGAERVKVLRDQYEAEGQSADYGVVTIAENPDDLPSVWLIGDANETNGFANWIFTVHSPGRYKDVTDKAVLKVQARTSEVTTDIQVTGQRADVEPLIAAYREKAVRELAASKGNGGDRMAARAVQSFNMADALSLIAQAAEVNVDPASTQAAADLLVEAQLVLLDSSFIHPQKGKFLQAHNSGQDNG